MCAAPLPQFTHRCIVHANSLRFGICLPVTLCCSHEGCLIAYCLVCRLLCYQFTEHRSDQDTQVAHLSSLHQRRHKFQEFERSRLQDRHEHAPLLQPDDCSHPTTCSATGYMQLCCRSQWLCCTGEQPQSATHTMTSVADSCRTPLQQWRGRAARPWPPPT
jgi:hypothetical protein